MSRGLNNPKAFSTQDEAETSPITAPQITDATDFPHTGLIKALNLGMRGNYATTGFNATSVTDDDVTFADGVVFRDGEEVAVTGSTIVIGTTTGTTKSHTTGYHLVVNQTGTTTLTVRPPTTTNAVPAYNDDDVIIAILAYTGNTPMQIQYLTVNKSKNSVSIARSNSGTYTEMGTITADTDSLDIVTTNSNADIILDPHGTGDVKLGNLAIDGDQTVGSGQNGHALIYNHSNGNAALTAINQATGNELENVVEDTSPQLGADLDTNSFNIKFDDAHGIYDDDNNEQMVFQKTASAVNYLDVTNAATGNGPTIEAVGTDTNIDLNIKSKGTTSQVKINDNMALDNGYVQVGNQNSSITLASSGTSAGYDLSIIAGSTAKGSNNLNGGDLILKSGGGDGTGTSVMTFFTKVEGTDDTDERMRIDTLGNLLIGGTGVSSTKLGVVGAVGAQAYHGAITEFTGNGLAGQNQLNLDASSMRTILTRSPVSAPNPPNNVAIQCPVSTTIEGWECRIICRENAGGADDTFIFTQGSDEIQDITGAVIADSSGTTFSLVAGKAYQLICIGNNAFVLYQIN